MFRLEPSIGPTLSNLLQKGITEQDIIGISQLVELLTNTGILIQVWFLVLKYQNENKNNTME